MIPGHTNLSLTPPRNAGNVSSCLGLYCDEYGFGADFDGGNLSDGRVLFVRAGTDWYCGIK